MEIKTYFTSTVFRRNIQGLGMALNAILPSDKESETDRWISHFCSMVEGIGDKEQRKFYVLKQKSNPPLLSTRVNTTKFNFIIPSEAVVDQAVEEIKRQREEPGMNSKRKHIQTRSTQRAQTSLAEADHYSHIVHCKNVEPWCERLPTPLKKKKKKKKKVLDHYLHHDLGMLPLLQCFFAHLLILQYPDHHQNLISSYLYYSGPVHKISSQSVHNFLSNVVHRQTNKQTNKQTDKPTLPKT